MGSGARLRNHVQLAGHRPGAGTVPCAGSRCPVLWPWCTAQRLHARRWDRTRSRDAVSGAMAWCAAQSPWAGRWALPGATTVPGAGTRCPALSAGLGQAHPPAVPPRCPGAHRRCSPERRRGRGAAAGGAPGAAQWRRRQRAAGALAVRRPWRSAERAPPLPPPPIGAAGPAPPRAVPIGRGGAGGGAGPPGPCEGARGPPRAGVPPCCPAGLGRPGRRRVRGLGAPRGPGREGERVRRGDSPAAPRAGSGGSAGGAAGARRRERGQGGVERSGTNRRHPRVR